MGGIKNGGSEVADMKLKRRDEPDRQLFRATRACQNRRVAFVIVLFLSAMDHHLPDEIISEILSPALRIPDEAFADTVSTSPFASYSQSTSAYLLVCKAWLRVSTPLLYNIVVIRSKAQARALEAALKSNKDLGAFIKKLRVEGGYGSPMKTILKCSPNITDLVLSLAIWSSDSVSGVCQGLHLLDPVRLIIHDVEEPGDNQQNLRLVKKLVECIQLWKRLVCRRLNHLLLPLTSSPESSRSSLRV